MGDIAERIAEETGRRIQERDGYPGIMQPAALAAILIDLRDHIREAIAPGRPSVSPARPEAPAPREEGSHE